MAIATVSAQLDRQRVFDVLFRGATRAFAILVLVLLFRPQGLFGGKA